MILYYLYTSTSTAMTTKKFTVFSDQHTFGHDMLFINSLKASHGKIFIFRIIFSMKFFWYLRFDCWYTCLCGIKVRNNDHLVFNFSLFYIFHFSNATLIRTIWFYYIVFSSYQVRGYNLVAINMCSIHNLIPSYIYKIVRMYGYAYIYILLI